LTHNPHLPTRLATRRRLAAPTLALLLAACGGHTAPPAQAPAPAPVRPANSVSPMDMGGQKVVILPMQSILGLPQTREQVTQEIVYALTQRDTRTQWLPPERLRASLSRAPGYAPDPSALPADPLMHHQERYVVEPLAGLLRRYTAIMDARVILLLREARWLQSPAGAGGMVRLNAALIDSRSGAVVWWGEADGQPRPQPDPAAIASAAESLAARMVVASAP
jgi:hypothetical protein